MTTAKKCSFKRILLLAPSHRVAFEGLALTNYTVYRTPLGDVEVDRQVVENLLEMQDRYLNIIDEAHTYEHALEVELPIVQHFFPDIKIVPLICGHADKDIAENSAEHLQHLWGPETLWIVSSDFTHYGASFGYLPFQDNIQQRIQELDMGAIRKIEAMDMGDFDNYIADNGATICGANPIKILLSVIGTAGKTGDISKVDLIDYITSGELTGDWSQCVSYAGLNISEKDA